MSMMAQSDLRLVSQLGKIAASESKRPKSKNIVLIMLTPFLLRKTIDRF